MTFLLDQSADARLRPHLESLGHDVLRIGTEYPHDLPDDEVLALAYREQRILIADDHDFGELVFRLRRPHAGVVLFRLGDYAELELKIERMNRVLEQHTQDLDQFIVVSRRMIRVRRV